MCEYGERALTDASPMRKKTPQLRKAATLPSFPIQSAVQGLPGSQDRQELTNPLTLGWSAERPLETAATQQLAARNLEVETMVATLGAVVLAGVMMVAAVMAAAAVVAVADGAADAALETAMGAALDAGGALAKDLVLGASQIPPPPPGIRTCVHLPSAGREGARPVAGRRTDGWQASRTCLGFCRATTHRQVQNALR